MKLRTYLPFVTRAFRQAGPPLHLTVFVTGRCNLRCRHCFHWKEVAEGVAGPSLADMRKLAASVAALGPQLWISFGGGEPFMRPDLPELARAFAAGGLQHLAIPTNGLIDRQEAQIEASLEACPDTFLSVAVSFDGPPAIHDAIRQIPGGHARSCQAFARLRVLARAHERLGVGLILTVTKENQDSLAAHLEELVDELAPDNVTINLARGTALDETLLEVDIDRYEEVVASKRRLIASGKLPYFDFPMARLAVARDELMYEHVARVARAGNAPLGREHLPCSAGKLSAVVLENGDVFACEMLADTLGNLNEHDWDFTPIWNGLKADALRERIRATRCKCTWECAQADNVLFAKRNWPRLAAKVLRP